ncbi:60S large subunit ribosomal protein uL24 (rpL26) [Andalucia godoyi]|uniref:60S large subunit ribosomal protein uL24 (RpL26) n=1 Tax=Andalucia godoyi TaxID=505711 RepID=A0A8K0F213_ANDGO|nr:60S large subunit ribosomal protein uL24 (rpL26) [Andalucia godoyi]WCZ58562.1 60S ribosomal protein L26 [Andalucia godoyi]|eukprot:ANDGO_00872.mRNA.1 60S large subunit ribosomal protein uL24 (rpL26)
MKFNSQVSSSRRVNRRNHFKAPSSVRRVLLSAPLSKSLRAEHKVRSLPVRKGDTVQIVRGGEKVLKREGKVTAVYRKRMCIYVDRVQREKANGGQSNLAIDPSNVVITKLKIDKDRNNLIARKAAGLGAEKGKFTDKDVSMAEVD